MADSTTQAFQFENCKISFNFWNENHVFCVFDVTDLFLKTANL
jgi:hypothetical protein